MKKPKPTDDDVAGRLAAIVQSSDDAIVSKDLEGVITSWNAAAEKIFGYTAAEAIGQPITLIIPPERIDEEQEILGRIRRGEAVEHFETVRATRDGRLINVSVTVSPIRSATGELVGASKISRDITDRKRAEEERASLLRREQAARAEAEALNRSKDEFLATLSHELRTPLNAIYGWARILHDGQLDPGVRTRGAEAILRNAKAQLQLVEDLLDISRIITGNMRLDVGSVDLKVVVEAALDAVRPAASAKDIRLQPLIDPRAGPIIGAADRLQQVVWNLLMNAVKFTPRGGRVQIHVRRVHSMVEIVVSDTGEGISPELLPQLFSRFRQGDSTSTRAHGGLGIGLALVRHLVDLHGGTVRAESPGVGRGATFTVRLPVALAHPEEGKTRDEVARTPSLSGVHVLVVDDDVDGLELARVVLGTAGAEVRTCTTPAEALERLAEAPADALVLDIEMPGEDGYMLLQRIRERGSTTPAIALTAYGRGEDRKRALAAGFNLYLAKPVDPGELAIAVANLAGRRA